MTLPFFKPHGSAEIERFGAILTVHMRGDWNAEMRDQASRAMLEHVPALNATGPWGIINVLHDTLVYSEDIYTNSRQAYAKRSPGSQLAAVAFVIGSQVEGAALMRPRFEKLLDGILPSRVFTDYAQAQQWLQVLLPPP